MIDCLTERGGLYREKKPKVTFEDSIHECTAKARNLKVLINELSQSLRDTSKLAKSNTSLDPADGVPRDNLKPASNDCSCSEPRRLLLMDHTTAAGNAERFAICDNVGSGILAFSFERAAM